MKFSVHLIMCVPIIVNNTHLGHTSKKILSLYWLKIPKLKFERTTFPSNLWMKLLKLITNGIHFTAPDKPAIRTTGQMFIYAMTGSNPYTLLANQSFDYELPNQRSYTFEIETKAETVTCKLEIQNIDDEPPSLTSPQCTFDVSMDICNCIFFERFLRLSATHTRWRWTRICDSVVDVLVLLIVMKYTTQLLDKRNTRALLNSWIGSRQSE